jgi:hypothetical protein
MVSFFSYAKHVCCLYAVAPKGAGEFFFLPVGCFSSHLSRANFNKRPQLTKKAQAFNSKNICLRLHFPTHRQTVESRKAIRDRYF